MRKKFNVCCEKKKMYKIILLCRIMYLVIGAMISFHSFWFSIFAFNASDYTIYTLFDVNYSYVNQKRIVSLIRPRLIRIVSFHYLKKKKKKMNMFIHANRNLY